MKWTILTPLQPGWYWWRSENKGTIIVNKLSSSDLERMAQYGVTGQWAGPIPEPEDE